jgi:membrane protease YdiL (CAAX protease family)
VENNSISATSPLSPTRWRPDAFPIGPSLLALIGAIAIVIVFASAFFVVLSSGHPIAAGRHAKPPNPAALFIVQDIAYVPLAIYLAYVVPRLAKRSLRDLGVRVPTARDLAAGVVGAIAMFLLVTLGANLVDALTHRPHEQMAVKMIESLRGPYGALIAVVSAVVIAPMIEEFVFRVFIFNALLRRMRFAPAAAISSLIFGIAHGDPLLAVPLALGGVALATVYFRTGCYWSNVLSHALFNGFSVIAILVFHVKA